MQPAACQQNVDASSSETNVSTPKTSCLQGRSFKIITTIVSVAAFAKIATQDTFSTTTKFLFTAILCFIYRSLIESIKVKTEENTIIEPKRFRQSPEIQFVNFSPSIDNFEALEKAVLTYQDDEENSYNTEIRETIKSICSYIKKHENTWYQQAIENQKNLFIPSSAKLIRSVLYNMDGSIYIHFNKKKKGDYKVGEGSYKIISLAFDYLSGKVLASSSLMERKAKDEIDGHDLAQQTEALHTLPVKYTVSYINKNKEKKVRILTPYCSGGDLSEAIRKNKLSLEQKKQISIKLIEAVIDWQRKGLLHLDIKPSNIFLTHNKILIGDLASFCKNDDNVRKNHIHITSWYASPEYVKALLQFNSSKKNVSLAIKNQLLDIEEKRKIGKEHYQVMLATISEQYDIWSLGCTLYQLHYPSSQRLPWAVSQDTSTVHQAILELDENWLPEPKKDTIHHLIWSMLRIDPAQRITYKELALKISNNF